MIEFGHATHAGLRRRCNEDTYYADPALGLFLVADGLGGHRNGALAATLVRDAMVASVAAGSPLCEAVREADRRIVRERSDNHIGLPMGTTLAVVRISAGRFEASWVGDSRIYLWNGALHRMSRDQTATQALVDAGVIDADEAADHPQRHVVTQALGVTAEEDLHIARVTGTLRPGDQLLLCSDGLTDTVGDAQMAAVLARGSLAAQECVDHLLLHALDGGGDDNVTAVLVRQRR
jgi:PPM family protein phosphatase